MSKQLWAVGLVFAVTLVVYLFTTTTMYLINAGSDIALIVSVLVTGLGLVSVGKLIGWGVTKLRSWNSNSTPNSPNVPVIVLLIALSFGLQSCTRVGAGYVGVKVNYSGDDRGVNDIPLETGNVVFMPGFSTVFTYPTFVQNAIWTREIVEGSPLNEEISFNTKDQMAVTCDVALAYELVASKVPNFYVKFRNDDIELFTHGFLRNMARDIFNKMASKYTVEQIMGEEKESFLNDVRAHLQAEVDTFGVKIVQFGFQSSPRPPDGVIHAINAKIQAVQLATMAENQLRQTEAEARKRVAQASGEAEANRVLTASISPQLIQYRQLEITEKALQRWKGGVPLVQGAGQNMLFELPFPQQE